MSQMLTTLQNDPKTSRTGTKWAADEEQQILDSIQSGMEYEQIALKLQRTVNSVKSRMMENHIRKVIAQEMTLEEVSLLLKIPMDLLTVAKRRYEAKATPRTRDRKQPATKETPERQPSQQQPQRNKPTNTKPKNTKPKPDQELKYMPILVEIRDYLKTLVDK
jgi:hypothetical protein